MIIMLVVKVRMVVVMVMMAVMMVMTVMVMVDVFQGRVRGWEQCQAGQWTSWENISCSLEYVLSCKQNMSSPEGGKIDPPSFAFPFRHQIWEKPAKKSIDKKQNGKICHFPSPPPPRCLARLIYLTAGATCMKTAAAKMPLSLQNAPTIKRPILFSLFVNLSPGQYKAPLERPGHNKNLF